MGREVVFIGAGYAHLMAITNLHRYISKGGHATVINPCDFQYYSGMGPGMLSGLYKPKETRFDIQRLTTSRGGIFIKDKVVLLDPEKRLLTLASGKTVSYDVASFCIGSEIAVGPIDTSYPTIYKAKPVVHLFFAGCYIIDALKKKNKPLHIVVVGGGAAGIEIVNNAWEIANLNPGDAQITLITRGEILQGFPPRARKLAMKQMAGKGILLEENMPVKGNTGDKFLLEDGRELPFDVAIIATGIKPSPLFSDSGIPTGMDGGLLVNEFLQSVRYPEIFGGGDCICFKPQPLNKVGVFAIRQNRVLFENLDAALVGRPLKPFNPGGNYLLVLNMGDGSGIFNRKSVTLSGSAAFMLKNYIDRKFMEEYQVSGELDDELNGD